MRKNKKYLALFLSAATVASSLTPVYAQELTDSVYELTAYTEVEEAACIEETTDEAVGTPDEAVKTADEAVETPGEAVEAPMDTEVEVIEDTEEPVEETTETAEIPAVTVNPAEDSELSSEPEAAEETEEAEDNTLLATANSGNGSYTKAYAIYAEGTGELTGVRLCSYQDAGVQVREIVWSAADGSWTVVDGENEYALTAGIQSGLYGNVIWQIVAADGKATGAGGYVLNQEAGTWSYYLTAADVADASILAEAWQSTADQNLPAAMFIGAEGDLAKHAGTQVIDGVTCFLKEDGTFTKSGWIQKSDGWYWMQEDGTILRTGGWQVLDGKRYFLKYKSGRRASGWETWSGGKYYLDPETGEVVTGMQEIDGQYYYLSPTGKTPGKMTVGWKTIDGDKYYFQANGARKKGWLTLGEKTYYFEKDGKETFGWRSISGKKYYFHQTAGYLRKGWLTIGNNKYYLNADGSQYTGWRSVGGKKYYFNPSNGIMKKGWQTINNNKYYFQADGSMKTGWHYLGGKVYYFAPATGIMVKGWLTIGDNCYYMGSDGARVSGIQTINGKKYYFLSDGKRVTNKTAYSIDGSYYSIDENGVLTSLSKAETLAAKKLDEIGWNLYAAFKWSSSQITYYRHNFVVPDGMEPSEYYAIYGFENGKGNCYIMAGTFYMMAKLLGYDVHQMKGVVPLRAGGWGEHSWCEVVVNGTTYVCDPDFTYDAGKNGYMITYGTSGTWVYSSYRRLN